MQDRDYIKSLEKGIHLISLISQHGSPLRLEDLVKRSGMKKTSCFRILQTLTRSEFVVRAGDDASYFVGPKLISIGLSAFDRMGIREAALPFMKDIRLRTGTTVNLAVLSGPEVIFVERLQSAYIVETNLRVGSRISAHVSSLGKAMLAFLPDAEVDPILDVLHFEKKTPKTITSVSALKQELREIRRRGFALNNEELEKGLFGIAAPLRNYSGAAVAAMNISFPLLRHSKKEAIEKFCPLVLDACRNISLSLGFQESQPPQGGSLPTKHRHPTKRE
jgi:IclR family transcriptional regulator, pca regulon regulatory protein